MSNIALTEALMYECIFNFYDLFRCFNCRDIVFSSLDDEGTIVKRLSYAVASGHNPFFIQDTTTAEVSWLRHCRMLPLNGDLERKLPFLRVVTLYNAGPESTCK